MSMVDESKTREVVSGSIEGDPESPPIASLSNADVDIHLSDLKLVILGSAFFAVWAGNVRYHHDRYVY